MLLLFILKTCIDMKNYFHVHDLRQLMSLTTCFRYVVDEEDRERETE